MTANVIPTPVSEAGQLYAISGFRGSARDPTGPGRAHFPSRPFDVPAV